MGRNYPSKEQLEKMKKDEEGPSFVDEVKATWKSVTDAVGGTYLNNAEESKKLLEKQMKRKK